MIRCCRKLGYKAATSSGGILFTTTRSNEIINHSTLFVAGCRRLFASASPNEGAFHKISFIGSGRMAEALVAPLIQNHIQPSSKIAVYDVCTNTMNRVCETYQVQPSSSIAECIHEADLICIAVKPQNCDVVFKEIREATATDSPSKVSIHPDATLLSIVAGKPMKAFYESSILRIARSMPNTPAMIGKGVTVWTATDNIEQDFKDKIRDILKCFGKAIYVEDEKFIDMSTSISGSGPAYIFLLMEAMIDAGVHMGFSRDMATTLCHHTLLGSTLYAMETKRHPAVLRNEVTSPAGTTASALYELEDGKFRTVIKDAIWACYRRGLEMGGSDSNVGPRRPNIVIHHTFSHQPPSGEMQDETTNGRKS